MKDRDMEGKTNPVAVAAALCGIAAIAAAAAFMAWAEATFDRRMEEARWRGAAEADAMAEAAGGWDAWARRSVDAWRGAHGSPSDCGEAAR